MRKLLTLVCLALLASAAGCATSGKMEASDSGQTYSRPTYGNGGGGY